MTYGRSNRGRRAGGYKQRPWVWCTKCDYSWAYCHHISAFPFCKCGTPWPGSKGPEAHNTPQRDQVQAEWVDKTFDVLRMYAAGTGNAELAALLPAPPGERADTADRSAATKQANDACAKLHSLVAQRKQAAANVHNAKKKLQEAEQKLAKVAAEVVATEGSVAKATKELDVRTASVAATELEEELQFEDCEDLEGDDRRVYDDAKRKLAELQTAKAAWTLVVRRRRSKKAPEHAAPAAATATPTATPKAVPKPPAPAAASTDSGGSRADDEAMDVDESAGSKREAAELDNIINDAERVAKEAHEAARQKQAKAEPPSG